MGYFARYDDTIRPMTTDEEDAVTIAADAFELAEGWEEWALGQDEADWDAGEVDVTELMAALDLLRAARETWNGDDDLEWGDNEYLDKYEGKVCTLWHDFLGIDVQWHRWHAEYQFAAA